VSGPFGRGGLSGSFGNLCALGFVWMRRGTASGDPVRWLRRAHDTAPALTIALSSPRMFTGKAATPPRETCSVADYGNSFNPACGDRTLDRQRLNPTGTRHQREDRRAAGAPGERPTAHHNMAVGQDLIAELNSFEVDFTAAGNIRVDVRPKDHHGDLVIGTTLAL
jgi:hypothetical protein